jgi:osmotically-inducible protein OsmY
MPTYRPQLSRGSMSSMSWRAAGAQFYPGGAYDALQEISHREISHRGKGPKGYRPTDARLAEVICDRLTDNPFIDARNINIDVQDGEVTLTGSVEERRQKYAAEDVVADVFGVAEVHNSLTVARYIDDE